MVFFKDLRNDVGNIGWFGCQMGGRGTVKESLPLVWKVTETGWCLVMSKWPRWWYPRVVVFLPRKLVKWSNWTYTYFFNWVVQPTTNRWFDDMEVWSFFRGVALRWEFSPNKPKLPPQNGSKGSSLLSNQHFFQWLLILPSLKNNKYPLKIDGFCRHSPFLKYVSAYFQGRAVKLQECMFFWHGYP